MNSTEVPTRKDTRPDIDYRSNLSYEEFAHDYLYPHKPVVITDSLNSWRALSRWTPQFFKEEFRDLRFTIDTAKNGTVEFTMDSFIDRVLASDETNPAPYFRNRVFHETFPSLVGDVEPLPKYIFPNWMSERFLLKNVQGKLNRGGQMEIYIGGKAGAFPYLHYDGMASHAFLLQIHGLKRFILFDPQQEAYLYPSPDRPNHTQIANIDRPDLEKFPLFAKAKPVSFVLEPGQMLFIPYRWWHTTKMLSPSISLSVNVLNASNWSALCDWASVRNPLVKVPVRMYLNAAGSWRTLRDRRAAVSRPARS
jgi:histone arginine demethylase JMJD6